jgi:hypothetical protein
MTQNCVMVSDELYKVFSSLIGYDLVCKIIVQESLQHLEDITINPARPREPFVHLSLIFVPSCDGYAMHRRYMRQYTPCHVKPWDSHIRPPKTTLPTPATSPFTPLLLLSSNSFTTPCTIIFLILASAFVNISAIFGPHSFGLAIKLISLV